MDKRYNPTEVEEKWVEIWSNEVVSNESSKESFSQVIPPPNVTGTLHMGHSFQYAIMDFYTRYNHMSGKKAHWQVGTDHAGIATQMVVENNLSKKNIDRKDLGREKFLQEVWKWKDFSEDKIQSQIKRLGSTVDWNKYRFTLDDGCNDAVIKAFVELYRKNKIYRGYRLVNWDPSLKTAVSDLEVIRQEKDGIIWHIKYPIEDSQDFVIVATTRPETMFGDMAVAVNPEDKRYKDLIGKKIIYWNQFSNYSDNSHISVPDYITQNSEKLRNYFLKWVYDCGETKIDDVKLLNKFQIFNKVFANSIRNPARFIANNLRDIK